MADSPERQSGQAETDAGASFRDMELTASLLSFFSLSGSIDEWRDLVKWALPRLILVVFSAGLTVAWFYLLGPLSHGGGGSNVKNFGFIAPGNEVPSCYTYYGTGKIPPGDEVLVFDRVVNNTHESPLSLYSPDWTVVSGGGNGWHVSTDIGTGNQPGTQLELTALLVRKGTILFLQELAVQGKQVLNSEEWKTQYLPPSLQEAQPLYVTFNGEPGTCS